MNDKRTEDILRQYSAKIEKQMSGFQQNPNEFSKSYQHFREDMMADFSRYERWCKTLGKIIVMKAAKKDQEKIQKYIDIAHLNVTPSEVIVFSFMSFFLSLMGGLLLSVGGWLLFTDGSIENFPFGIIFLIFLFSIFLFYYNSKTPERLAMKWRLKASAQMVPAILYIVIYMKHTSNFEKAVAFAAEHMNAPLGLDFRKIFWDVEIGKFSSIKYSIDSYLEIWRDYSIEFIEAFHLIESSLYESSEERRIVTLEKALQVILDGVYDKMLKYTHNVKSPLTNIYMLGIVLPTLALAILPLASVMMGGVIKTIHVAFIFNILVPFLVVYMTTNIMMSRPGGHGDTSMLEQNPLYASYKSKKPYAIAGIIIFPLLLIGLIPAFLAYTPLNEWIGIERDYTYAELGLSFLGNSGVFGILTDESGVVIGGPHGGLSLLLSLFVPLSIALFFVIAYKMKTKEMIKSRDQYKEVEAEFTTSLFQLGNRIGDGMPAEIAFAKVAESSKGTSTEGFFTIVNQNLHQLGMGLEQALFNPKRGAVVFYPSNLIETSMRILIESVKKGLKTAARSLMSISEYVKNIKKIDDRLNDMLADIISDMKSNMTFLAPLLAGIIVGLSGMITTILGNLTSMMEGIGDEGIGEIGGFAVTEMFKLELMMPVYWLQVIVGIYLVEIVFILTSTLVTIKSGKDDLEQTKETGSNLKISIFLYLIIAMFSIIGLTILGAVVLAGLSG